MIPLREIAACFADRPLFIEESGSTSYSGFIDLVEGFSNFPEEPLSVAVPVDWSAQSFARFCAALNSGHNVFPGSEFPVGDLDCYRNGTPLLILRTGGSSGKPLHVVHSVDAMMSKYVLKERLPSRQLVLYAPDHIAGLDAFLQAIHQGGSLIIPRNRSARAIAHAIESYSVEVVPATPTMLQFLLLSGDLDGRDLSSVKVIPHGAEPMPDALRHRLEKTFPQARLRQRFGMTELGALPVREDPEDPRALYLEAPQHTWKIQDGELLIWSPGRMLGTLEGGPIDSDDRWYRTGDLAERTARGSIRIMGRQDLLINVGGTKVYPETVEEFLLEHPLILDAHVYPVPNPMTGQAVAAHIVCEGDPDLVDILSRLRSSAREKNLPLACVPTRIEFVTRLEMTAAGKRLRLLKA